MANKQPRMVFKHRGRVERFVPAGRRSKATYGWREGYSQDSDDGRPTYPWMTRAECRAVARREGAVAVFEME